MKDAKIIVVGSLNFDMALSVPRFPLPGETLTGTEIRYAAGGKGANQAVAAARLGVAVAMVGKVGNDSQGKFLLEQIKQAGVDSRFMTIVEGCPSGIALIQVDPTGENCIVIIPGANALVSKEVVDAASQLFKRAEVVLLQLESPIETVQRSAEVARDNGLTVILNPTPARVLSPGLLSLIDILILNEIELEIMTGMDTKKNEESLHQAARKLLSERMKAVIITLGKDGSVLVAPDMIRHFPSFSVDSTDSTAAGDAFVAGFAVAYSEKKELAEAMMWGNAAGALTTTKQGAQPSLPYRKELMALLSTQVRVDAFSMDKG
jgi:ribokinase